MQTVSRRASSIFITTPLLLFASVLMIAALYYRNRDVSIVLLLILSIGGAAKIWTMFGHNGIEITAGVDKKRAFPGHVLDFNLTLTNSTYLPLWCRAIIPLNGLTRHDRQDAGTDMAGQTSLLWHDVSSFAWKLDAPGRGIYRPGPISLASGDLFGFFPRERTIHAPVEIIVYPRLVPLRSFPVIRRDFFGIPGDESPVRDPVYILGTHDYQFGRPARFIHWKASARRRVLQEKVFEPTEQEKIFFVVLAEGFEKEQASAEFERMLEAAASIAARGSPPPAARVTRRGSRSARSPPRKAHPPKRAPDALRSPRRLPRTARSPPACAPADGSPRTARVRPRSHRRRAGAALPAAK